MKPTSRNPRFAASLFLILALPAARAATLTWDTVSGDGASITAGTGAWNTTATNWNNAGVNEAWSQTSATAASHAAVFAGSDGSLDQYVVTLSGTVNAQSVTFDNSGYRLQGGALTLITNSTTNGSITVAAGKTATIASNIVYNSNRPASFTVGSGAVLNLTGGAGNSQYNFSGDGTVNITASLYNANIGIMGAANLNISGGEFLVTPGNNVGYQIFSDVRNTNFTLSGGKVLVNGNNAAAPADAFFGIGGGNSAFMATMTMQDGAELSTATTSGRAGEIRISNTATSNGTLDIQGGTFNVSGMASNQIYLFKNGATAGYTASMTQSAGTVTTNGIQFGGATGTYEAGSSANLTLSGGSLYIGAAGITRGSAATDLPTTIQLQGGTLGADQNWISALDMQLGTSGGGVTIRAANAAAASRTITLNGILSGTGGLVKTGSGTLFLRNANTFEGGITIQNGIVTAQVSDAALGTGTVTMGGAGSTGAALLTGRTHANNIIVNAPDSGAVVMGANGAGSGFTISGGITLNGNLTIRTFDNVISGSTKAQGTLTGGITGTGNVVLDNLGLAANSLSFNTGAINHSGSLTLQGSATGDTTISAGIGANVTSVVQNSATSRMILSGINSYTGDTDVNFGQFLLAEGGRMRFDIRESGVNNRISGTVSGNVTMDGIFEFDLTLAGTGLADTWNLVDLANLGSATFGPTFGVADFTNAGEGLWNRTIGETQYQFSTNSGTLSVIPEPAAALLGGLGLLCLLRRRRS